MKFLYLTEDEYKQQVAERKTGAAAAKRTALLSGAAPIIGPRRVSAYCAAKPARCTRLWKRSFMVFTPATL